MLVAVAAGIAIPAITSAYASSEPAVPFEKVANVGDSLGELPDQIAIKKNADGSIEITRDVEPGGEWEKTTPGKQDAR
ncbi:hypothetical protein C1I98_17460 [Spongiactinospora gelatinilytica]|uniref:Uncharacterized protein n=1 Tax=Spongiactinospora gelatinilytica TaxID=2666298 RepID=A0A2W2H2S8_9ACTN|nr:hypothetical protein [Spongiactinospora gelatinilytica]PZG44220.1 hypothetical protein C1I98_17460 [Spongiactinospora gelatinilytica]